MPPEKGPKNILSFQPSKMGSQISSCSSFSELKTVICFESGLKVSSRTYEHNAQNEILQIMTLKALCYTSVIVESGYCSIMAD